MFGLSNLCDVSFRGLLLKLIAREVIDNLAHVLGIALDRLDHASDHERKMNLARGRLCVVSIRLSQLS